MFADAYRGFLILETEMIGLYEEIQGELGIRCAAEPAVSSAGGHR